jgi:carboxypeptidase C (cathepsin A)|tara:strand:+ start:399 stop:896 length:498 start_codon:yes stop_codon:yes gene_type:complete
MAMEIWLNRTDVRAALNIQSDNRFNSADNGIGMNYTVSEPNVLPIYENARANTKLRVLVYNGDTDPGINSMKTQSKYFDFFDSISVEEKEAWRPWTLDGKQRMGGYVVSYPGDFSYLTIRGSGHMVPEYKPAASLAFISAFVKGEEFKRYVAPSRRARNQGWYEL